MRSCRNLYQPTHAVTFYGAGFTSPAIGAELTAAAAAVRMANEKAPGPLAGPNEQATFEAQPRHPHLWARLCSAQAASGRLRKGHDKAVWATSFPPLPVQEPARAHAFGALPPAPSTQPLGRRRSSACAHAPASLSAASSWPWDRPLCARGRLRGGRAGASCHGQRRRLSGTGRPSQRFGKRLGFRQWPIPTQATKQAGPMPPQLQTGSAHYEARNIARYGRDARPECKAVQAWARGKPKHGVPRQAAKTGIRVPNWAVDAPGLELCGEQSSPSMRRP